MQIHQHLEIIIRSIAAFLILLLIARALGKQTLGKMTFHDFAAAITFGSMAANLSFNQHLQTSYFLIAFAVFAFISYMASKAALNSKLARKWISGEPTVLIEQGKILEANMRSIKYTMDTLNQSLREKDIFNIEEVEYAILENNGQLSVQKKEEYKSVTRKDLQLQSQAKAKANFPIEVIMDGQFMEKNLNENGLTQSWLEGELRSRGKKLSEVFYGVKASNGSMIFDYYKDKLKAPIDKQ